MQEDLEEQEQGEQEELFEHHRIIVDKGQSLLRIDKFLLARLQNVSRNRIQNASEAGSILVNGKAVKSSYRVKPLDLVTIVLAHPPRLVEIIAENIPLNIVYEDDDLIIVNKQAGLVVHPGYGNYTGTLVNALAFHFYPELLGKSIEAENERPGLVHRIDKNTSGLVVIARTEKALTFLAKQFFDRTIKRRYIALVWGDFDHEEGTVTGHIGRNQTDRKSMEVYPGGEHGKHAVTHYKVIERLGYLTIVECRLETGRTHQIRAHMKYIGHPLFNDETYGGKRVLKGTTFNKYKLFVENCFTMIPGQALHARSLGFIHPTTKKELYFEADLPANFQALIDKWKNYIASRNES
ncbi:MAG: RluA family pseudouridine synthase [Bacteroidetes bacterium]|nr:RluA family pseudouridine synthase [Bacteroidota bacterium]